MRNKLLHSNPRNESEKSEKVSQKRSQKKMPDASSRCRKRRRDRVRTFLPPLARPQIEVTAGDILAQKGAPNSRGKASKRAN